LICTQLVEAVGAVSGRVGAVGAASHRVGAVEAAPQRVGAPDRCDVVAGGALKLSCMYQPVHWWYTTSI